MIAVVGMWATALPLAPALAVASQAEDLSPACKGAPSAEQNFADYDTATPIQQVMLDCLSSGYVGDDGGVVLRGGSSGADFGGAITRAQWMSILMRFMEAAGTDTGTAGENPFEDVPEDGEHRDSIVKAVQLGITTGKTETTFDPGGDLNLRQLALFTYRSMNQVLADKGAAPLSFDGQDVPAGCATPEEATRACDALDDLGFLDADFDGNATATRGEAFLIGAAQSLNRMVSIGLVPTAHVAAPPRIIATDIVEGTDAGNVPGILDVGDMVVLTYDRTLALNSDAIELTDDDGTVAYLDCGAAGVTCTLADYVVVTVTIEAAPNITVPGAVAGLDFNTTAGDEVAVNTFGLSNDTGFTDISGSLRVIFGSNADLPAAIDAGNVTAAAGSSEVTIADAADLATDADVYVYSDTGQWLGSAADNGTGGAVVTLGTPLAAGQVLDLVVYGSGSTGRTQPSQTLEFTVTG